MFKSVLNAFFCAVFLTQSVALSFAQGIVVDPNAPGGQQPTIIDAPNGVPIENIAAPNAAGLSHNKFIDFNVDGRGLILNNSTSVGTTGLAGVIAPNPHIAATGPATTILNEVTSSNRSLLEGATELFGGSANYILANPNGITCNGCGFVGIPRTTLTTGRPVIDPNSGLLSGLSVEDGTISIGPNGLDGRQSDYFDIISRAFELNGVLQGKDVAVITGRNDVDYAGRQVTAVKPDNGSAKPEFSIDSTALGGMYANTIKLVGTEKGVGVRAPANVSATAGDIQITADGRIVMGNTSASRNVTVRSHSASVDVNLAQHVYAGKRLAIEAGQNIVVAQGAAVGAGEQVSLTAQQNISLNGSEVVAGLAPDGSLNPVAGVLELRAVQGTISNATTKTWAGAGISINSAGAYTQSGELDTNAALALNVGSLELSGSGSSIRVGSLSGSVLGTATLAADSLGIYSVGNISAGFGSLAIASMLYAGGAANLGISTTANVSGYLETVGDLTISGNGGQKADLNVSGTLLSGRNLNVDSNSITAGGVVAGLSSLSLSAANDITFHDGAYVQSGAQTSEINAGGNLSFGSKSADYAASLFAEGALVLRAGNTLSLTTANTAIASVGRLDLFAASASLFGEIESSAAIAFDLSNSLAMASGSSVVAATAVDISADQAMTLQAGAQIVGNDVSISGGNLTNAGSIGSLANLETDLVSLTNQTTGELISNETINLQSGTLDNAGKIDAGTTLAIATTSTATDGARNRSTGQIEAEAGINATFGGFTNEGKFAGKGSTTIAAANVTNVSGAVIQDSTSDLNVSTSGALINQGSFLTAGDLTFNTNSLDNDGGLLLSVNSLVLEGVTAGTRNAVTQNRNGGVIEALTGDMTIRSQDLRNHTVAVTTSTTTNYANEFITGAFPPNWFRDAYSTYAPHTCGECWGQFFDYGGGPGGYMFLPHPDVIAEILESQNATPDQWDPTWWQTLGPQSVADFDPAAGDLARWSMLAPDEDSAAGAGATMTIGVTQDQVTFGSSTSRISTGAGNITLDVGSLTNTISTISSAGDMTITGGSLTNEGVNLNRTITVTKSGVGERVRNLGWGGFWFSGSTQVLSTDTVQSAPGIIHAAGSLTGNLTGTLTNQAGDPFGSSTPNYVSQNSSIIQEGSGIGAAGLDGSSPLSPVASVPTFDPTTYQFNRQLFGEAPATQPFLYETRHQFVDLGTFYGSSYFLDTLGVPNLGQQVKSLGDSYFETRFISDQIFAATGQRWLSGDVNSDASQMKQLIDNAGRQASDLNLAYGIALSRDQIALLTSDIVWYEKRIINGQEVIAPRLYLASSTARNTNGAVIAGGDVSLQTAKIENVRGKVKAKATLVASASDTLLNRSGVIAGRDVSLSGGKVRFETAFSTTGDGENTVGTWVNSRGVVTAENSLEVNSDSDIDVVGADVSSGGTLALNAEGDVNIAGLKQESLRKAQFEGQDGSNHDFMAAETRVSGSTIQSGGDLTIEAGEDVNVKGSLVASDGAAKLAAGDSVNIGTEAESTQSHIGVKKSGFLSGSSLLSDAKTTSEKGSMVTALGNLEIEAGSGDVTVRGSSLSSEEDIAITAERDVRFEAGEDTFEESTIQKRRGPFASSQGLGVTVGYKSEKHTSNTSGVTKVISSAVGNNITINAGRDVTSEAAALLSDEDLRITAARDIALKSATDLFAHDETHKVDTIALSVSVFENVSGPVKTLIDTPRAATSGRGNLGYQAISAVSAGLRAVDAVKSLTGMFGTHTTTDKNGNTKEEWNGGTIAGVNIGVSVSREKSRESQQSSVSRVTNLSAGNDLVLEAGRDIVSEGAQIDVGNDATITAGRDIELKSAKNTTSLDGSNSSRSAGVGLTVGIGLGGPDISVNASVSAQNGEYRNTETTNTNTDILVGGKATVEAGRDLALKGASIDAGSAEIEVGRDLTVESQLDTAKGSNSSKGVNAGINYSITSGTGGVNAGANMAKGWQSRAWVDNPSGILTDDELNISVGNKTSLTGGVLASRSDELTLETETLETKDLDLHDKNRQVSGSVSVNVGRSAKGEFTPGASVEGSYSNYEKEGIAHATIGEGTIVVRDGDADGVSATRLRAEADAAEAAGDADTAASLRAMADAEEAEDTAATETQLANLNRDPDKVIEVTKVTDEGFDLYVSDTSVRAVADIAKKAKEYIKELVESGQLSSSDAEQIDRVLKRLEDVDPTDLAACRTDHAFYFHPLNWIVTTAHASGGGCILRIRGEDGFALSGEQQDALRESVVAGAEQYLQDNLGRYQELKALEADGTISVRQAGELSRLTEEVKQNIHYFVLCSDQTDRLRRSGLLPESRDFSRMLLSAEAYRTGGDRVATLLQQDRQRGNRTTLTLVADEAWRLEHAGPIDALFLLNGLNGVSNTADRDAIINEAVSLISSRILSGGVVPPTYAGEQGALAIASVAAAANMMDGATKQEFLDTVASSGLLIRSLDGIQRAGYYGDSMQALLNGVGLGSVGGIFAAVAAYAGPAMARCAADFICRAELGTVLAEAGLAEVAGGVGTVVGVGAATDDVVRAASGILDDLAARAPRPRITVRGTLENVYPSDEVVLLTTRRKLVVDDNGRYWLENSNGSKFTPSGNYDFVTMPDGTIRVARPNETRGSLHSTHLGLSDGGEVSYAGSITFTNSGRTNRGQISTWSNNSGHYLPPADMHSNSGLPSGLFLPTE